MYDAEPTNSARWNEADEAHSASSAEAAVTEQIRMWLATKAAELLSIAPETLYAQEPLINFGLSSMTGLMLSGDIEEWLDLELDPMVIWEYPTIEALALYLSQEVTARQVKLTDF
jgi:acyl carrier protein